MSYHFGRRVIVLPFRKIVTIMSFFLLEITKMPLKDDVSTNGYLFSRKITKMPSKDNVSINGNYFSKNY